VGCSNELEYLAEIGSERFLLKPGDSILLPRESGHLLATLKAEC
jgi:hypothetical protein